MKIEQSHQHQSPEARACVQRSTSRTGSALLIVIGTLALISVFAVVYLSIGRTDRRTANAVKAMRSQQDSSTSFADYFSSIIGQDRLDAYIQYDGNGNASGRREVTDAPYTDWTRRSESNFADGRDLFTTIGGPFSMGGLNQGNDFSVASDPWLASTTPVYLGNPGPVNTERPFSSYEPFSNAYPNGKNFLDARDWLQISNFAPDGRFVNLFNLRSNTSDDYDTRTLSGGEFGSFFAEPGVGSSEDAEGRDIRRMSNYLSLWNKETNLASSSIKTFDPGFGNLFWTPGQNLPVSSIGVTDVFNTPAVWTMYQRFMYMPINQPFITKNRNGDVSTWADPDFPAYQYADADGDGMVDSRWFELVAARDKREGDVDSARDDIEVLYDNDSFRYFIAAYGIDLSSKVNVNTATDLLVPPTSEFPLGLTPADVDLRRLLTMQDQASDFTSFSASSGFALPLSYRELHRPFRRAADNEPMWGVWNQPRPDRDFVRNVSDYLLYQHDYASSGSDLRDLENNTPAMLIGRFAYDALRQGLTLGSALTSDYIGFTGTTPTLREHLREYERDPASPQGDFYRQITPAQRVEQYHAVAQLDPTKLGTSWARNENYGSGLYGLEDLTELLTFHGLNDPEVTSRLERVTNGRYDSGFGDQLQTMRYGPLMSNRSLDLARDQHGYAVNDLTSDNPTQRPDIGFPNYRSVNGQISFNSMAQLALSPRNKMTTLSGSVPLVPSEMIIDPSILEPLTIGSAALPLWVDPNSNTSSVLTSANDLFTVYSKALAGELALNHTYWPVDITLFPNDKESTLFYGHRGAELALRIAAHTAVNMKDLADADGDPTVATVLLGNQNRSNLGATSFDTPGTDSWYELYPGIAGGNVFDPGETNLLSSNLPAKRQLVNVYGFEASPILTEVSVLYAYTDAPIINGGGGDQDYNAELGGEVIFNILNGQVTYPDIGDIEPITIDGLKSATNDDYLIQVLAFQLHNPYDQPISLGGTGIGHDAPLTRKRVFDDQDTINKASNYQFDYYIEYAGRFYKIADYIEWYPTDESSKSYYINDSSVNTPAYSTVDNPSDDFPIPSDGVMMDPGTETPTGATPGIYTKQALYSDFISRNVVLNARETRVFYVIADKRFDDVTTGPDARWTRSLAAYSELPRSFDPVNLVDHDADNDLLIDGRDSNGWTGPAEEWVEHQFSVRTHGKPYMMMEFDPRDGKLLSETPAPVFEDPTVTASTPLFGNRNDIDEVRLWKKIVTVDEEADETDSNLNSPTYRNLIENDLLVDRMDIPTALTKTFNGGSAEIDKTVSFIENLRSEFQGVQVRNDNKGLTYSQWKTVRRSDSPTDDLPSYGEITPWMLRSRSNPDLTRIEHDTMLKDEPDAGDLFAVVSGPGAFDDPETQVEKVEDDFEYQLTLRSFFDLSITSGSTEIIQTVALPPHMKHDVLGGGGGFGGAGEDDIGNRSDQKFADHVLPVFNTALDITNKAAPEIFIGGNNVTNAPRLADLLLAWGIGAAYAPDPTRAAGSKEYEAEEWMTGPEAMAIALGIEDPSPLPTPGVGAPVDSIWDNPYSVTFDDYLLDDGHLVIDDFVPFLNVDTVLPAELDLGDVARGLGVPAALGVIDHARALPAIHQIGDPDIVGATLEQQLELALTRPIFGTININTAPVEVLRLLPGLTPSRGAYSGGGTPNEWWARDRLLTNLPDMAKADHSGTVGNGMANLIKNPDVAAAIVAYRDRTYGIPNTAARPEPMSTGSSPPPLRLYESAPLNFEPTDPTLFANNMRGELPFATLPAFDVPIDRSTMTGINDLRPTPGFGSLGELLAVRIDPEFGDSATATGVETLRWDTLRHLSIQQYGFDTDLAGVGIASGIDGTTTIMSQIFAGGPTPTTGTIANDYAEKISMATSVLNTLSVRSDYYAVWFVVQGYKESDVKNLRPEDPLVPSLKKRYLMVVDRSNVIEPGDKPKILVLKELPL